MADFTMKPQVDVTGIANILQKKAIAEAEAKQQQRAQRMTELTQTIKLATDLSNNMVENSKQRQKQAFVTALGESMAASVKPTITTFNEPRQVSSMVPPVSSVSDPNFAQQDLMRSATNIAPEKAAEHVFGQAFPKPLTGNAARVSPMKLEFPDGTQGLGYFDPVAKTYFMQDGQPAPDGTRGAYKYDKVTDSEGNTTLFSGASGKTVGKVSGVGTPTPPEQVGRITGLDQLPPTKRREVQADIAESKKEPSFRAEYLKTLGAARMHDMLEARNFVFDQKIGLQIAKTMGDAGNVAIVEQAEGKENKQLFLKGVQILKTYVVDGTLTESNRQDLMQAVKIMDRAASKNLNSMIELDVERMTAIYPELSPEFIRESLVGKTLSKRLKTASESSTADTDPETEANDFMKSLLGGK